MVAALGVPLCALAQSPAESGKPTEVTGVVVALHKPTKVTGLTVTAGCPLPADSGFANVMFDAPPNTVAWRTEPSAGTKEWLEKNVAMFEAGTMADAPRMDAGLTKIAKEQIKLAHLWVMCRGALKSIKFLHVSAAGYDDYEVEFANGAIEWEVAPLNASGQAYQSTARYFYPQPESRVFRNFLDSISTNRPNYSNLAPAFASTVQAQWPELQKSVKDWGRLNALVFLRQEDDRSYDYVAVFAHRKVVWEVAPLDDKGRLTDLNYAEADPSR
jgi:hypothetical protein